MTFEGHLYDRGYFEGLHESHWFIAAIAGFRISLDTYSVSPFPGVRWIEAALAPLPLVGETFRYRILLQAKKP